MPPTDISELKPLKATSVAATWLPNTCSTPEECAEEVLKLQLADFSELINDIRFNFLITPHGIFEGRGWDVVPFVSKTQTVKHPLTKFAFEDGTCARV